MLKILLQQLKDLLNNFIKPSVINATPKLTQVQYEIVENQKSDNNLFVGVKAKEMIDQCSEELELPVFYSAVREHYSKSIAYMLKKFPYEDPVRLHAAVADITCRENAGFESVCFFIERYPCLKHSAEDTNILEREFNAYQTDNLPDSITTCDRADTQWHLLGQKTDGNGQRKYAFLSKVMLAVLCIFHSNADCERVFSLVTKNKTQVQAKHEDGYAQQPYCSQTVHGGEAVCMSLTDI